MSTERARRGLLVAIEGTRGSAVRDGADRLWAACRREHIDGGISRWDASGTFYELVGAKAKHFTPSARTLLLLYAADLRFRLRWEILPALDAGHCVVAAPYVVTATAFGLAMGLPSAWLADLFAQVPQPDAVFRVKERKRRSGWDASPAKGFCEAAAAAIGRGRAGCDLVAVRQAMMATLDELEVRGGCARLRRGAVATLVRDRRTTRAGAAPGRGADRPVAFDDDLGTLHSGPSPEIDGGPVRRSRREGRDAEPGPRCEESIPARA